MIKKGLAITGIGITYALNIGSCALLIVKGTQNPLAVLKGFAIFIIALSVSLLILMVVCRINMLSLKGKYLVITLLVFLNLIVIGALVSLVLY